MSILIKDGHIIDPANNIDTYSDVLIDNGIIVNIAVGIPEDNAYQIIDARGCLVVPGLIDLHTHLREPGYKNKETIESGSRAAVAGGYTTICAMPNTYPTVDNAVIVEIIRAKAKHAGLVNILPIGTITKEQAGERLADISEMIQGGICAVSEDGKSVRDTALLKTAMQHTIQFSLPVFSHCEDTDIDEQGQIISQKVVEPLNVSGIAKDSEHMCVARDISLAKETGARLHICHVSTANSVSILRWAKAQKISVTAEVTPHHFTLIEDDIPEANPNYKMNPPLRKACDRDAIRVALAEDTIDCIATDHAPHSPNEKSVSYDKAPNGVIGMETAFAIAYTELVLHNIISLSKLIEKMSRNPAIVLGINKGTLSLGASADLAVIEVKTPYRIKSQFASKSCNCPFIGREVYGRVRHTILNGCIVYDNGVFAFNEE
ncbi:MAG: dihydroorotase [Clostridiales bacterium]|nr:dihydroorotase [Clostridiales bacterium]